MNNTTIRPSINGTFPRLKTGVHKVCLGNSSMFNIGLIFTKDNPLFVAVEGHGAYSFGLVADFDYVQAKLNLRWEGDAANITDFINDQLFIPGFIKRQGAYAKELCEK